MTKKEEAVEVMNKCKLGYGLLREYISRDVSSSNIIEQVDADIEDLNHKIRALNTIKEIYSE